MITIWSAHDTSQQLVTDLVDTHIVQSAGDIL